MSLDKFLIFSLKLLAVVLVIEFLIIIYLVNNGNVEEEYNHYMPNPVDRMQ